MFYKKNKKENGFTLIEMLVVIAIIGILTAISVENYSKFTDDAVLTNMAYELALSIREAQVYGTAVSNQGEESFGNKYGINFIKDQSSYTLFVDQGGDNNYTLPAEFKKTYTLQRGVTIGSIRRNCQSNLDRINILFKRPNPEPIITGINPTDGQLNTSAQIELISKERTKKYVIVSGTGQIYVSSTDKSGELCPIL